MTSYSYLLRFCIVVAWIAMLIPSTPSYGEEDFVYVCKDAGAGAYEAFPDVCRLKDGRLMCVIYAGYHHASVATPSLPKAARVACCYSSDEGQTWSEAETLYDGPDDDRDPSITQLKDGRLILSFFPCVGAENVVKGVSLAISDDGGKTWGKQIDCCPKYAVSSPVRELSTGRLILGIYKEEYPKNAHPGVIYSDDGGQTWTGPVVIDNAGLYLDAETDVIELKDGTLFALHRSITPRSMYYTTSKDKGTTWGKTKPVGFQGHCPYLLRTTDGIIVAAFRHPKTSMRYSLDECQTWSDNVMVDKDCIGAYPAMVNLKDGSVLIVYYEEGRKSNIRSKRFRVSRDGVEWLSLKKEAG
jgi:sialidase-1